MSVIDKIGDKKEMLAEVLFQYEEDLEQAPALLQIEGKTLEYSNVEQATNQALFDEKRIELATLVKFLESEVARIRGKLWRSYTENMSLDLGPKDKDQYINNEQAYLSMHRLLLEAQETYKKYEAVVEAFKSRGFALRNITNLRVASLENIVL